MFGVLRSRSVHVIAAAALVLLSAPAHARHHKKHKQPTPLAGTFEHAASVSDVGLYSATTAPTRTLNRARRRCCAPAGSCKKSECVSTSTSTPARAAVMSATPARGASRFDRSSKRFRLPTRAPLSPVPSLVQCDTAPAMDFDSQPALLTIIRCGYVVRCRAGRCISGAATILRKSEASGRPLRQIDLCTSHAEVVILREQRRGLTVSDWR